MTQQTDFRVLCAELTDELSGYASANPHHDSDALVIRARAALAQPEPRVKGPTDEELLELWQGWNLGWDPQKGTVLMPHPAEYARAVLARWGRPTPAPAGGQGRWTEGVCGDGAAILRDGVMMPIEEVVAELNRHPAPAPAGEVGELVAWLRNMANAGLGGIDELNAGRAADLLEMCAFHAVAIDRENCNE